MELCVLDIVESCKNTIIGHIGNIGTEYFLLHIVHYWRARELDKENWVLLIVIYCSGMLYKHY